MNLSTSTTSLVGGNLFISRVCAGCTSDLICAKATLPRFSYQDADVNVLVARYVELAKSVQPLVTPQETRSPSHTLWCRPTQTSFDASVSPSRIASQSRSRPSVPFYRYLDEKHILKPSGVPSYRVDYPLLQPLVNHPSPELNTIYPVLTLYGPVSVMADQRVHCSSRIRIS